MTNTNKILEKLLKGATITVTIPGRYPWRKFVCVQPDDGSVLKGYTFIYGLLSIEGVGQIDAYTWEIF